MSAHDADRHRNSPVPTEARVDGATSSDARTYEFRVVGHLDDEWSAWFDQLTIAHHDDGTTTLTGPVADQAQLHGVLARLRDLGGTLLSVHALTGHHTRSRRSGPS